MVSGPTSRSRTWAAYGLSLAEMAPRASTGRLGDGVTAVSDVEGFVDVMLGSKTTGCGWWFVFSNALTWQSPMDWYDVEMSVNPLCQFLCYGWPRASLPGHLRAELREQTARSPCHVIARLNGASQEQPHRRHVYSTTAKMFLTLSSSCMKQTTAVENTYVVGNVIGNIKFSHVEHKCQQLIELNSRQQRPVSVGL